MATTTSKLMKLATGAIKFLPEAQWVGIVAELLGQLASSIGATSGDSKQTLAHIESLQGDLRRMTDAHSGLAQQFVAQQSAQTQALVAHTEKLTALGVDLQRTNLSVASVEARLKILETSGKRSYRLALIGCGFTFIAVVLLIVVLVRQH